VVNGKEQPCIVVPIDDGQLFYTNRKELFVKFIAKENDFIDENNITHRLALMYHSQEDIERARREGYRNLTEKIGLLRPLLEGKTRNYSNEEATDIYIKGYICLDDVRNDDIEMSPYTGVKSIKCNFKTVRGDGTPVFLAGSINVSDIIESDIITNYKTGRRNVPVVMKRMELQDSLKNTHILCVVRPDGGEVEIGRFREFKEATKISKRIVGIQNQLPAAGSSEPVIPTEQERDLPPTTPIMIDGYNF
jgi:hypothetical protein